MAGQPVGPQVLLPPWFEDRRQEILASLEPITPPAMAIRVPEPEPRGKSPDNRRPMKRSEDRILTTHVGSLIRSKELREAAARARSSPENTQSYEALLRSSVDDVVKMQAKAGINIVDDGEYGKANWANYILDRVTGFELRPEELRPVLWLGRDLQRFPEVMKAEFPFVPSMEAGLPTRACVAPIQYRDTGSIQRDIQNLKAALKSVAVEEAFLPVVAPASAAYTVSTNTIRAKKNMCMPWPKRCARNIAPSMMRALRQVDDGVLANMYDHLVQQAPENYRRWAGLRVEALNHALKGIPEDRVRYVCFGSWHVPHIADAPLEEIVDFILTVRAGAYSIEAANPATNTNGAFGNRTSCPKERS